MNIKGVLHIYGSYYDIKASEQQQSRLVSISKERGKVIRKERENDREREERECEKREKERE